MMPTPAQLRNTAATIKTTINPPEAPTEERMDEAQDDETIDEGNEPLEEAKLREAVSEIIKASQSAGLVERFNERFTMTFYENSASIAVVDALDKAAQPLIRDFEVAGRLTPMVLKDLRTVAAGALFVRFDDRDLDDATAAILGFSYEEGDSDETGALILVPGWVRRRGLGYRPR